MMRSWIPALIQGMPNLVERLPAQDAGPDAGDDLRFYGILLMAVLGFIGVTALRLANRIEKPEGKRRRFTRHSLGRADFLWPVSDSAGQDIRRQLVVAAIILVIGLAVAYSLIRPMLSGY